jgi:hypothetical protein
MDENKYKDALERIAFLEAKIERLREDAAKQAESRTVLGYVSDIGCFNCFDRIAKAIRKLSIS